MRGLLVIAILVLAGCPKAPPDPPWSTLRPLDVVIVPGCPAEPDGTLSVCLWHRAAFAADLWEAGRATTFITSGNAVHNRYVEAEALEAAMVALGVPDERIHKETQALHTDENAAYSLAIIRELGMQTVGVASHTAQARGMRAMLRGWGQRTVSIEMDMRKAPLWHIDGPPTVELFPVPVDEWIPLREREELIAERLERRRRPSSLVLYPWLAIKARFAEPRPPDPPTAEPTRRGLRHRVDTRPW